MLRPSLVVITSFLAVFNPPFAETKVEQSVVGRAAARTEAYMVSKSGVHYAVLTPKGSRNVVVVDGVEGPEFDVFLNRRGMAGTIANNGVVFSADGSRHAYFARIGNQYILVVDGKELVRGELGPSNLGYHDMQFSPGSKHVYFIDLKATSDGRARAQLVMDGKAGPPTGHQDMFPVFSPDESRWAYNGRKFGGRADEFISVVDGKEVPFVGFEPVFTGDNKLLASLQLRATDPAVVTVDGKPAVKGVAIGGKIGPARVGSRWAGVVQPKKPGEPNVLYMDGKEVPEAQNVEEVIFSPDGKRYMAICRNNATRAKYVVLDGKKGPEYPTIVPNLIRFAPDSSRAIYVGNNAGKNFVVVDGQPSEGYQTLMGQTNQIAMSQKGGHYGYLALDGAKRTLVIDGKPVAVDATKIMQDTLGFNPDGSRYAYAANGSGQSARNLVLVVSGEEMPGIALAEISISQMMRDWWIGAWGVPSKYYMFSPDGKHIAFSGMPLNLTDKRTAVFVDGKPVVVASAGSNVSFVNWSPDSQHLFWTALEKGTERPQPYARIFVDGKPTPVRLFDFDQPVFPGVWQVGKDGVLQVLIFEGAVTKRYRITPGSDTSIQTLLAAAAK